MKKKVTVTYEYDPEEVIRAHNLYPGIQCCYDIYCWDYCKYNRLPIEVYGALVKDIKEYVESK